MPRPTFMCTWHQGRYPNTTYCRLEAAILVTDNTNRTMDGACHGHMSEKIMERLVVNPRAKIAVRNARTWHTRQGEERDVRYRAG